MFVSVPSYPELSDEDRYSDHLVVLCRGCTYGWHSERSRKLVSRKFTVLLISPIYF
jgi:hypothetical protein